MGKYVHRGLYSGSAAEAQQLQRRLDSMPPGPLALVRGDRAAAQLFQDQYDLDVSAARALFVAGRHEAQVRAVLAGQVKALKRRKPTRAHVLDQVVREARLPHAAHDLLLVGLVQEADSALLVRTRVIRGRHNGRRLTVTVAPRGKKAAAVLLAAGVVPDDRRRHAQLRSLPRSSIAVVLRDTKGKLKVHRFDPHDAALSIALDQRLR